VFTFWISIAKPVLMKSAKIYPIGKSQCLPVHFRKESTKLKNTSN